MQSTEFEIRYVIRQLKKHAKIWAMLGISLTLAQHPGSESTMEDQRIADVEAMLCHKMLVAARDGKEDIVTVQCSVLQCHSYPRFIDVMCSS